MTTYRNDNGTLKMPVNFVAHPEYDVLVKVKSADISIPSVDLLQAWAALPANQKRSTEDLVEDVKWLLTYFRDN